MEVLVRAPMLLHPVLPHLLRGKLKTPKPPNGQLEKRPKEKEQEKKQSKLKREGWCFARVLQKASKTVGVPESELFKKGRGNALSQGKALLCKWMVEDLGVKQTEVGRELKISQQAVKRLADKGRLVEIEMGVKLGSIT